MHGEIISFYVEPAGNHVIMTVSDPSEGGQVTVRASKLELATMADAEPMYVPRTPPQAPTPEPRDEHG